MTRGAALALAQPSQILVASLRLRAAQAPVGCLKGSQLAIAPVRRVANKPARSRRRAAAAAALPAASVAAAGSQSDAGVDPFELVGFTVLDVTKKNAVVGVVEDVLSMAETGQAQPLLHVCTAAGPGQAEDAPREEHLIPFVPQIIPRVDAAKSLVYVRPPKGLLELGRQHLAMANLERDLEPFTQPQPLSVLARMGLRIMPTAAQLESAGRRDLVAAVKKAGGFLEVAQALGLRSQRKPAGYWDDEGNLDMELTLFVAAHWTQFSDPESRQPYWYNQVTHRITWEQPVLPEKVEIDDEGGYIMTEAEEDRVMPSRSAIKAAGRWDLHHAILHHGGYTAAAELLERRPAWPPSQHLQSQAMLRQELREFLKETGLPPNRLPSAGQLNSAGRGDLLQAIKVRGGWAATAAALGWSTRRRGRKSCADVSDAAAELRGFILRSQFGGAKAGSGRTTRSSSSSSSSSSGSGSKQPLPHAAEEEGEGERALPAGARMPTHRELMEAGRHDLRYALQRHSSGQLAALLGLQHDARGAHNRRGRPPSEGSAGEEPPSKTPDG